jgi:hypothetical protein
MVSFVCLVVTLLLVDQGTAQSGASYTAQRRIDTITIDGMLTEASWVNAASTSVFMIWNGSNAPPALETTAKMVWDDQYLYIAFIAKDPDVYATYTGNDTNCWEQDNFEVFVTVPGTPGYVEAEGGPAGATWDGYWTNSSFKGPGAAYNLTNLLIASHTIGTLNNSSDQDSGFISEIRFPFADVYQGVPDGHPSNGSALRLNLNRINWNTPATPGGKGQTGSDTYLAWSPVPGKDLSFHRPDKFGTVSFSTDPVPAPTWIFADITSSGSELVLSGIGHPSGAYCVLVSSNLAAAPACWTRTATSAFDSITGQFCFTNTIDEGSPHLFYRLESP